MTLLPGEDMASFEAGQSVVWRRQLRGGYGYTEQVPATYVRRLPSGRAQIRLATGALRSVTPMHLTAKESL